MKKEVIFTLSSAYRDEFSVMGYKFGKGEKSCCIIGAIRGNEIQQLYMCSQLIKALSVLEKKGDISYNHEIMVIPSLNHYGMNISKRFWSMDNTDINRMFPGNINGETTERIAAAVFNEIKDYQYGIQFASFYLQGDFIPHIRMMKTCRENTSLANLFGTQYVVLRNPSPFDTTTLNYNWQQGGTAAFSVYTNETDTIDEKSASLGVASVLRFMSRMGAIKYKSHGGYIGTIIEEDELMSVKATTAGIYRRKHIPGDEVEKGDILAEILHPYEGTIIDRITAPCDGILFFAHNTPLVMENTVAYKMIKRLHI